MQKSTGSGLKGIEIPLIRSTSSAITLANHLDHGLTRLSWRRGEHKVSPGLYALGNPNPDSPVFVSANYTLSFDALRKALKGINAYILVLNTFGINVWCAAGKRTFGTEELIERVDTSELVRVVKHRTLILPQLSATGVSAHEVKKGTGFKVEYGPVRTSDIPAYLNNRKATPQMRRINFNITDRAILIPVEIVGHAPVLIAFGVVFYFLGGWILSLAAITSILAGVIGFPLLLPFLPTKDFTTKGFILGFMVTIIMALLNAMIVYKTDETWWLLLSTLGYLLIWPPVTAFIALNFTGASTFTSRSGVRCEMSIYLRGLLVLFVLGLLLTVTLNLIRILG
jgi:hypothetical protein